MEVDQACRERCCKPYPVKVYYKEKLKWHSSSTSATPLSSSRVDITSQRFIGKIRCHFVYWKLILTAWRVRQPPSDQQNKDRVGLLYFCSAHDDVVLKPVAESPVLQWANMSESRLLDGKFPTVGDYSKARVMAYGGTQPLKKGAQRRVDEEIVGGVLLRHYNWPPAHAWNEPNPSLPWNAMRRNLSM